MIEIFEWIYHLMNEEFIKDCIESMNGWIKCLKGWDTKLDSMKKSLSHFLEYKRPRDNKSVKNSIYEVLR